LDGDGFINNGETEKQKYTREDIEMKRKLKRCSKCVLPETFPKISFNARGVCNFCTIYQKPKPDPAKEKTRMATQNPPVMAT
jgi:hypothetical protein